MKNRSPVSKDHATFYPINISNFDIIKEQIKMRFIA